MKGAALAGCPFFCQHGAAREDKIIDGMELAP